MWSKCNYFPLVPRLQPGNAVVLEAPASSLRCEMLGARSQTAQWGFSDDCPVATLSRPEPRNEGRGGWRGGCGCEERKTTYQNVGRLVWPYRSVGFGTTSFGGRIGRT